MPAKLFVLDGPAAAGKTTFSKRLLKDEKLNLTFCPRITTREPEPGDTEYDYVSSKEFERMVKDEEFASYRVFLGGLSYGVPRGPIDEKLASGQHALAIVDLGTGEQIKETWPEAITIFLVSPAEARGLLAEGAVALDVFAAQQSRFDELEGTWLVSEQRLSLPGAVWLPEVGRGRLSDIMQRYLENNLARVTAGNRDRALLVYCVADCWMSWNAAQRIAGLGYSRVYWFRLGTDGWLDIGETLAPVDPVPVDVD